MSNVDILRWGVGGSIMIERCSSKTGFGGASGDLTLDEEIRVVNILKVPMSTTSRWDRGSGKETGAHTRRCQFCLA